MTKVLAIGPYSEVDQAALRDELDAGLLASLADLAALPADQRDGITALAYQGHDPLDGAVMDLLPKLRLIANFGVGYDAINVDDASARGITVTNTPDVLNDDVADLAIALLLAQSRRLVVAENWLREGEWAAGKSFPLAHKMTGRKVGILGLGRIGREIADRLAAFKCEIHYFSRSEKTTPGWQWHSDPLVLARAVDDIVVSVVGGAETQGLVSAQVIDALGPDGIIVNISRGTVIDEDALIAALQQGRIRGAGLDVFKTEPKIDRRFLGLANATLLPHVGSATVETRAEMGALQRQNIRAVLDGQPPVTPVN